MVVSSGVKILTGFVVGNLIGMTGLEAVCRCCPSSSSGLRVPAIVAIGSDAAFNFLTADFVRHSTRHRREDIVGGKAWRYYELLRVLGSSACLILSGEAARAPGSRH